MRLVLCIALLTIIQDIRSISSTQPLVDCSEKEPGWSGIFICPSSSSQLCTDSTCSSCIDCQLKFPGTAPMTVTVTCVNQSFASYSSRHCTEAKCSYCMGCNLTSLAYVPAENGAEVAVCTNCNSDNAVYWDYGGTYSGTVRRGLCQVNLTCGSQHGVGLSRNVIAYRPIELQPPSCPNEIASPQVSSMMPEYGPLAGGTAITLYGEGLHNLMSLSIGNCVCRLESLRSSDNSSQILCRTTACNVTAGWYNLSLQMATPPFGWIVSDLRFQYKENPVIFSVESTTVFETGGLMVNFTGNNLGGAASPEMTITAACKSNRATKAKLSGECLICDDERQMVCSSPDLTNVSRNASQDCSLEFLIGLQFDGYSRYSSLSQLAQFKTSGYLIVVAAPSLERFGLKTYDPLTSSMLLTIFGGDLTAGAQQGDYCVAVGKVEPGVCNCKLEQLVSSQLTCRLPSQEPPFDERNAEQYLLKSTRAVTINIGNLQHIPGHVVYIPLILVEVLVPVAVAVIIAGIAAVVRRRRLRRQLFQSRDKDEITVSDRLSRQSNVYLEVSEPPGTANNNYELPENLNEKLRSFVVNKELVELGEMVGQGHFGKIFSAMVNGRTRVAAKLLRRNQSEEAATKFLEEAAIMTGFDHPNVLGLLGVVLDINQPIVLVPFMERGDLRSILRKQVFPLGDCLNFCLQIARGMAYLSAFNFVHRDLAARNCLVSESYLVKIGDFGLAHELDDKDYYRGQDCTKPLPVKWMAPESLETGVFTSASDVWSYGVVMWEIFSRGITPYADVSNSDMKRYLRSGRRLERPHVSSVVVYRIMEKCWNRNPLDRPTFSHLISLIEQGIANTDVEAADRLLTQDIVCDEYSYALNECDGTPELCRRSYLEIFASSATPTGE